MTVRELLKAVEAFPEHTEVTVYVEGYLPVLDSAGDRIDGFFSGMLEAKQIMSGELFSRRGVLETAVLKAGELF